MQRRVEREWKSILCPEKGQEALVACEWEVVAEKGCILERHLKQIDCHNPELTRFGAADCRWECERTIRKRERSG